MHDFVSHNPFGRELVCGLTVYRNGDRYVALVTELPHNPGMSVTNAIECIAQDILVLLNTDLDHLTLIEHYPERNHVEATYDLVKLEDLGDGTFDRPVWQRLSVVEVDKMLQGERVYG